MVDLSHGRLPASGNSYRSQQRDLIEFYNLAMRAIDNIDELNFAYSPQTYSGQLPYAFIDYPSQSIQVKVHSLKNQRMAQQAKVSLNIHVFVKYDRQGDAVRFVEQLADFIFAQHPFDMHVQPLIEADASAHFILTVTG